jgi:hypothetical protein
MVHKGSWLIFVNPFSVVGEATMTQLPVTYNEVAAVDFARSWVKRMLEGDFLGLGLPPLHPQTGSALLRRMIQEYAMHDPGQMLLAIDLAYLGVEDARIALSDLILEFTNRHEPLPSFLAEFNARMIRGSLPARLRGQKKITNYIQDVCIATLVMELIGRFCLKPTRYQYGRKRKLSASSIVADILSEFHVHRGGETDVQDIWRRWWPILFPQWRQELIITK